MMPLRPLRPSLPATANFVTGIFRMNSPSPARPLDGRRVLIAEDSWHIAFALQGVLEAEGAVIVGPVASVGQALDLVDREPPEIAVVDVNLRDESAAPLIDRLASRGIAWVILSGYQDGIPRAEDAAAVLGKPVSSERVVRALLEALAR